MPANVRRADAAWHRATTETAMTSSIEAPTYTHYPFDARGIARRFRRSANFGALVSLEPA